jgi:squalene synthase HpnC
MRRHVAAVYAFVRTADDIADEGVGSADGRQRQLDEWRQRLSDTLAAGGTAIPAAEDTASRVLIAVANTIRVKRLPAALFDDLISAFRQDTTTNRYATWPDLLDYCRRSANPVGRIVLRIAGYDDAGLDLMSDGLCTALQLTNFWQDLEVDWRRGRLYVPAAEWCDAGAKESDLTERRMTAAWKKALERSAGQTRQQFEIGRRIGDRVGGRLGIELRFTWLGGMRILERLERAGFDVFTERPSLGWTDAVVLAGRALRWRRLRPAI